MMIDVRQLRSFQKDDLANVLAFLGEVCLHSNFCSILHPGDFTHNLSNGLRGGDPSETVFVGEDENGRVRAAAIIAVSDTTGYLDLVLHSADQTPEVIEAGIAWCEQAVKALATRRDKAIQAYSIGVLNCDQRLHDVLLKNGYMPPAEIAMIQNFCVLPDSIPASVLPDGFTIRNVESEAEADALGTVHSGAFGSNWPPGEYRKVMQATGFHPERELIVVAPDSRYAAFLIYWIDPISQCGLFEPVGCHTEFQRRGLTKALMFEGMRRMVAQDMTTAMVKTNNGNEAALALYHSVGFQRQYTITDYRKPI